jgi:transcriptional regulator with PAS, ATPase and Fis domain
VSVKPNEFLSGRSAVERLPCVICAFLGEEQQEIVKHVCSTCLFCDVVHCSDKNSLDLPSCMVPFAVLVGVSGDSSAHRHSLEAIVTLKKIGCVIIACGKEIDHWTVSAKSKAFLAGASVLVDCAPAQFGHRLAEALRDALVKFETQQSRRNELMALAKTCKIVGDSPAILESFQTALRMSALSDLPALITGESGTGKELFASALHSLDSKRNRGPFVAVNCAAVNSSLAESEFFGHVRGAFTGAHDSHTGYFLAASGGVLFLDEVGELSLDLQAKLLRVIHERRISKVGSTQEVPVDVRVVSATHRDLRAMIHERQFREDLFYRLSTLTIRIPPLREHKSDIAPLILYFLSRELGSSELIVEQDFVDALSTLDFPGNVRELKNLLVSSLVNRDGNQPLGLKDLPPDVWKELVGEDAKDDNSYTGFDINPTVETPPGKASLAGLESWNLNQRLAAAECEIVSNVLRLTAFNQSRAAQILGVTPRCVYNKVKRYQLTRH